MLRPLEQDFLLRIFIPEMNAVRGGGALSRKMTPGGMDQDPPGQVVSGRQKGRHSRYRRTGERMDEVVL